MALPLSHPLRSNRELSRGESALISYEFDKLIVDTPGKLSSGPGTWMDSEEVGDNEVVR